MEDEYIKKLEDTITELKIQGEKVYPGEYDLFLRIKYKVIGLQLALSYAREYKGENNELEMV